MTLTALPTTSAGRFSPFGPLGMIFLLLTGKHTPLAEGLQIGYIPVRAVGVPYASGNKENHHGPAEIGSQAGSGATGA
jgi:hypothetical protein